MPNFNSNLLIVDDEPVTRQLLSRILTGIGHDVRSAADGLDAIRQMRETTPDIVLSDLNMPHMSGFELLSVIRRRHPQIYAIATSGAYTANAIPTGIPADAFYAKASGLQTLLGIIESASNALPSFQRPALSVAPIWVSNHRLLPSGFTGFLIGCPECLRTLSRPDDSATSSVRTLVCDYCEALITYSVAVPMGP